MSPKTPANPPGDRRAHVACVGLRGPIQWRGPPTTNVGVERGPGDGAPSGDGAADRRCGNRKNRKRKQTCTERQGDDKRKKNPRWRGLTTMRARASMIDAWLRGYTATEPKPRQPTEWKGKSLNNTIKTEQKSEACAATVKKGGRSAGGAELGARYEKAPRETCGKKGGPGRPEGVKEKPVLVCCAVADVRLS